MNIVELKSIFLCMRKPCFENFLLHGAKTLRRTE
jgi:hypothetical protein